MLPQATAVSLMVSPFDTLISNNSNSKKAQSNPTKNMQQSLMSQKQQQQQQQEEGFADVQPFVLQTIATYLDRNSIINDTGFIRKTKNQLRNALCLYSNGALYTYPVQIDQIPTQITPQYIQQSDTNNKISWLTSTNNNTSSLIANINSQSLKISQFVNNGHMTCIYNRHAQNLAMKSDMTIYIRNVRTTVQCDMIREFTQSMNNNYNYSNNKEDSSKQRDYLNGNNINSNKLVKLEFHSNYQCGNLHSVFRQNNTNNYYLFLQNDVNTHGYNQWFNFWVKPVLMQQNIRQQKLIESEYKIRQRPPPKLARYDKQQLSNKKQETGPPVLQIIHSLNSSTKLNYHNSIAYQYQQPLSPYSQSHSHQNNLLKIKHTQNNNKYNDSNNNNNMVKFIIVNISKDIKYRSNMSVVTFNKNNNNNEKYDNNQHNDESKNGYKYDTPFIYYKNKYQKYNGDNYMTIQFEYNFNNNNIVNNNNFVQFSLAYPYSYTKLFKYLRQLRNKQTKWNVQVENIGKSEGNNCIYSVKITNKSSNNTLNNNSNTLNNNVNNRKCIIVIARQHPGQPVSSFICQHLINTITTCQHPQNQHFDWFIIPMANPDGVIHGNSRTNLKGYDINRCWEKNSLFLCAEVQIINKYIQDILKVRSVSYIVDLHGHSKDFGTFVYFCENNQKNKVLNYLLTQKCAYYDYYKAKFGISYKKRPTFRGQMYYRMGIKNSITIQTSLFGYRQINEQGEYVFYPFTDMHYKQISQSLYSTLIQYQDEKQRESHKSKQKQHQIRDKSPQQGHNSLKIILLKVNEMQKKRIISSTDGNDTQTDSDSNPQDQYLQQKERKDIGIQTVNPSINTEQISNKRTIQIDSTKNAHNQNEKFTESNEYKGFDNKEQQEENNDKPQRYNNRIYLDRFQILNRKNQTLKSKRKPIYTNSNVQILSYDKMDNIRSSLKKYSVDQSGQFLSQKTLDDLNKAKNSASFRNKGSLSPSEKRVNGVHMKVKETSIYPTATNVKIDREIVTQLKQENTLFALTKTWKQNQLRNASSLRKYPNTSNSKFKSTPSIKSVQHINKLESSTTIMKGKQQELRQKKYYQEYSKLKRYLLSRDKKSTQRTMKTVQNEPDSSIQLNMISSLAVVCQHAHRSQTKAQQQH